VVGAPARVAGILGPMTDEDPTDVDALVARVRAVADERRRRGDLPDDVETEIGELFRRVRRQREVDLAAPELHRDHLRRVSYFTPDRIDVSSKVRGGDVLHQAVARAVSRQTSGVLQQVQEFADAVVPLVVGLHESLDGPVREFQRELTERLNTVIDELAELRAANVRLGDELDELRAEVAELRVAAHRP
jgi:hypothetical protein